MQHTLTTVDGYEVQLYDTHWNALPKSMRNGNKVDCSFVELATVVEFLMGKLDRCAANEALFVRLGFAPSPAEKLHFVPSVGPVNHTGTGALMSLVAQGVQNESAEGNGYSKTYGKNDERVPAQDKYAEASDVIFDELMPFGWQKNIPILRNADGWTGLLGKFLLPALPKGTRWRSNVAEKLVQSFELRIGGQTVYPCSGPINAAICTAFGKWPAEQSLRYAELSEAERQARSQRPWLLVFPLFVPPMWDDSNLIELLALPYHEIRLFFTLAKLADLVVGESGDEKVHVQLEADYVYMDDQLRKNIAQSIRGQEVKPSIKLAHELVAKPTRRVSPGAVEALRRWFACVDAPTDRSLAADAGLFDEPCLLQENADRLLDLVGRFQQGNVASAILGDPRCVQLWTRYASEQAAMLKTVPTLHKASSELQFRPGYWKETFLPQVQWQVMELDCTTPAVKQFPLYWNHPCSLLMLSFSCSDDCIMLEADAHPFESLELSLNGRAFQHADAVKAHQWNWLKCSAKASPLPNQKFYLVPFSKHALDWSERGFPCHTNMSRVDSITLKIIPNAGIKTHWQMQVATVNQNILRQVAGMAGVAFSD